MKTFRQWAIIGFACLAGTAHAQTVRVAVASNFSAPMQVIVQRFEAQTGHSVKLSLASSGKFFAQIQQNAPFDVFLSADSDKPVRLEQLGLTVANSRFVYAQGALALWSAQWAAVDANSLQRADLRYLALANPKLAPYGVAAMQTLDKLGLLPALQSKFVQGENIAQTYQFVQSGNASLGFVALSQVMRDGAFITGAGWVVPTDLYQPILQEAVLLKQGADNQAAQALLDYLKTPASGDVMRSFGYQ